MAPKDRNKILAAFKGNKKNRRVQDAQELLAAFGFQYRPATKELGGVWKRGSFTITLPLPHGGGDKSLAPRYISLIIRIIELAEASNAQEEILN